MWVLPVAPPLYTEQKKGSIIVRMYIDLNQKKSEYLWLEIGRLVIRYKLYRITKSPIYNSDFFLIIPCKFYGLSFNKREVELLMNNM